MAKALKTVGLVLGAAALVATGLGAVGVAAVAGVKTAAIASVASIGAGIANAGAAALAGPLEPPPARGSVTQMVIEPDAPQPYVMGSGVFAGALRHRVGYGPTLDDVKNPHLFDAVVYSGGGPVKSITPWVDFGPVPSWYDGFVFTDAQTGATPEANALAPHWSGAPGWSGNHKLSGQAAIGWSFNFDKDGEKYASGLPPTMAYLEGVLVYDPRRDDTFPGGAGSCRLGDESTYVYSENPALHAGTYAYGRYQNGKRTFGMGLPADAIDWAAIAAWANVCEVNGWTLFGVIFEPGDRWGNLKDICAAGGCEPVPGGILAFRYFAPVVAIDTITSDDLAEGDLSMVSMASYRDRINTIIPKYTSTAHNWELVPADAVAVADFVSQDGEERKREWPFNFVDDADQAAQLAGYILHDLRERQPITLPCGPRLRGYRPGDCLHLDLPELGLDIDARILSRTFDPATMTVVLTFAEETPSKHAEVLGLAGVGPALAAANPDAEERDTAAYLNTRPPGLSAEYIKNSHTEYPAGSVLSTATETQIAVIDHLRLYSDRTVNVTGAAVTVTEDGSAIAPGLTYWLYYDDAARAGGAVSIKATRAPVNATNTPGNPGRHYLGVITTPSSGSGESTSGGGSVPSGWGGGDGWSGERAI